jgi:hypothetical protein
MRWKSHVRFGGRTGETHPARARQGAPVRPLHALTVAAFVAAQRTDHGVPHVVSCRVVAISESWFYKWRDRPPTARPARRGRLDAAVRASFDDSGGTPGTYGSPRVGEDLIEAGGSVSKKSVAASMAGQGVQGRCPKRKRRSLTGPDKAAAPTAQCISRSKIAAATASSPNTLPQAPGSGTGSFGWEWLASSGYGASGRVRAFTVGRGSVRRRLQSCGGKKVCTWDEPGCGWCKVLRSQRRAD